MIKVSGLYKNFKSKRVLENIHLELKEGEILGLIGPNGAGKSTLIKIITGLLEADQGTALVHGMDIQKEPLKVKALFGLVPQELALIENLSAWENLHYFGSLYNLPSSLLKQRMEEALDVTGMSKHKKEKVSKFSGGMKRRLNLAASILHEPKLLILDEPTVGVDPQSRNHIFDYIKRIREEKGTSILYTSHYMEEVEALCDRIFIIDEGKEIAQGTKEELGAFLGGDQRLVLQLSSFEELEDVERLQGVTQWNLVEDRLELVVKPKQFNLSSLLHVLDEKQIQIYSLSMEKPRLEDLFLSLTGKNLRD